MISPFEDTMAGLVSSILIDGIRHEKEIGVFAKSFWITSPTVPVLSGMRMNIDECIDNVTVIRDDIDMEEFNYLGADFYFYPRRSLELLIVSPHVDVISHLPQVIVEAYIIQCIKAHELKLPVGKLNIMLGDCYIPNTEVTKAQRYMQNVTTLGEWKFKYPSAEVTLAITDDSLEHTVVYYDPLEV